MAAEMRLDSAKIQSEQQKQPAIFQQTLSSNLKKLGQQTSKVCWQTRWQTSKVNRKNMHFEIEFGGYFY